jgi:hypothetical protein
MRRLAFAVLLLAACGGESGVSPDLEAAREAARQRAEARVAAAQEACRARGEEVVRLGPRGEWACGQRGAAALAREEARWRERCAASGTEAFRQGAFGWFCARATADAGRECRRATDCEGVCLATVPEARSGRCSGTTVVPGCVAQFGPDGRRVTACAR